MKSENLLAQFEYENLPPNLHPVAHPFKRLAHALAEDLPFNNDTSRCLRDLGRSRHAAIRSALSSGRYKTPKPVLEQEQDQD